MILYNIIAFYYIMGIIHCFSFKLHLYTLYTSIEIYEFLIDCVFCQWIIIIVSIEVCDEITTENKMIVKWAYTL